MEQLDISFFLEKDFGLELEVVNNEILIFYVIFNFRDCLGGRYEIKKLIYEKPWTDYLTEEEMKEFMEMKF